MPTEDRKTVRIIRRLPGGSIGLLGRAVQTPDGWRFLSNTQTKNSRKAHPTLKACLPRGMSNYEMECA